MCLLYGEETDDCTLRHARNGREYRPERPHLSVEGSVLKRELYEFYGCLFHGHTSLPFRDVTTFGGQLIRKIQRRMLGTL